MKHGYKPSQTMTSEEFERLAYIKGDTLAAKLYTSKGILDSIIAELPYGEEDHGAVAMIGQVEELGGIDKIQSGLEDLELYKQFFLDCFERLNWHYPCPSVTDDHDKSVIFAAIERGESCEV